MFTKIDENNPNQNDEESKGITDRSHWPLRKFGRSGSREVIDYILRCVMGLVAINGERL